MNLSTFDADGRKQAPTSDRWVLAFIVFLIVGPALASWAIAELLDANLSPVRVAVYVAGFLAMASLFAIREWCWRIERAERIAYEHELRLTIDDLDFEADRMADRQARIHQAMDDLIANPCPTCGSDAA